MNPLNYQSQDFKKGAKIHDKILSQIEDEYQLCWRFCRPKIQENLIRLKLYNNQKRDKTRVGDPLLFTVHQTLMAALYDDRLNVDFLPREEGDEDKALNLNGLAEFDYDEMQKDKLDYQWIWDSTAFGRGLVLLNEFDRDSKTPVPENIDSLTFVRDPRAISVNGDRLGNNGMRFGGREIRKTKKEMRDQGYFNTIYLSRGGENEPQALTTEARTARRNAQGYENTYVWEDSLRENYEYTVLQWFTHFEGEKYVVELANNRRLIVRIQRLEDRKGEPVKLWPIIDRPCYPMSHDWDGVNVFDIIEDKQRFRAELLNVAGDSAKLAAYPMWLFDTNKITKGVDKNVGFDKWIPINGNPRDAVMPRPHNALDGQVQYVMDFLDLSSQRALATPESQMGVQSSKKRTLGETELVASKSGTRYGLTAKVFGWSEREFWKQWYRIYDRDFEDGIDTKVMRIMGTFGPKFQTIKRGDIITENLLGPDIKIESRVMSEAKKIRNYQLFSQYFNVAFADPTADKLYGIRELGKLIMEKDKVERLLPLSIDERKAKEENDKLSDNDTSVIPKINENHNVHLRVHAAAEDTKATRAHIKAHEQAIMMQRENPDLIPEDQKPQQGKDKGAGPLGKMTNQPPKTPKASEGASSTQ